MLSYSNDFVPTAQKHHYFLYWFLDKSMVKLDDSKCKLEKNYTINNIWLYLMS